jgi:hypothetical protein
VKAPAPEVVAEATVSVHAGMVAIFRQAAKTGRSLDECAPDLLTGGH